MRPYIHSLVEVDPSMSLLTIRNGWTVVVVMLLATVLAVASAGGETNAGREPAYIGSPACDSCHQPEFLSWSKSHHSWAWRAPTAGNVLGDFEAQELIHKGGTARFSRRDGRYFVEADGPQGRPTEYEVRAAVGVEPLQQYLVETEPGRLQALDFAWDTVQMRWYHLYPDDDHKAGDGLHWTGPYKNWNARCAECHATGFEKNYDPLTKTYESVQAEIGVGCEACHGPAEAHVAWADSPAAFEASRWAGVGSIGLSLHYSTEDADVEIQQCAGCHSRREPIGASSPTPGSPFADNYRLALLREGLYHADGQMLDEVYVFGSFLQSRMYTRGVRCSNCHNPHSANLVAEGNAVCTQCHSPAGNPKFPTLRMASYDAPVHHFHKVGASGSQCVSCHMPMQVYMVVDGRRDHSFQVPRPDLSVLIGTPNACTTCHTDHEPEWAVAQVTSWYPAGRTNTAHYGTVLSAARSGVDEYVRDQLLALATNDEFPVILRASALSLLSAAQSSHVAEATAHLLENESPLVRAAAIRLQRGAPVHARAQRVLPLLADPMRSVRIEGARLFLDLPVVNYPPDIKITVESAMSEYQASLIAKADFPETQMVIGGTAMVLRNWRIAERAFREAVSMDQQMVDAWFMIARLQMNRRDLAAAETTLLEAIEAVPKNGNLHHALSSVLSLAGKDRAALPPLERASCLLTDDPVVLGDLGMLLSRLGEHERAVLVLDRARQDGAHPPEILYALASSQLALGNHQAAERAILRLELFHPNSPYTEPAKRLLGR